MPFRQFINYLPVSSAYTSQKAWIFSSTAMRTSSLQHDDDNDNYDDTRKKRTKEEEEVICWKLKRILFH